MKISKAYKDQVLTAVLKKCFDARRDAHAEEERALAEEARLAILGDHAAAFDSLPSAWVNQQYSASVAVSGEQCRLYFAASGGATGRRRYEGLRPCPPEDHNVSKGSAFGKRVLKWRDEGETIDNEYEALRERVQALLSAATTYNRLRELWPEGAEFMPEPKKPQSTALVAVGELNAVVSAALKKAANAEVQK